MRRTRCKILDPSCAALALLAALSLSAGGARAGDALERASATGPVSAVVRVEPPEPRIGDPVVLELEVRADPEVELLMPEFGQALDRFAIVDFVPGQRFDDQGATVATQRYTLQPSRSGAQRIPPLRIEFVDHRDGRSSAPEGEDAYELLTEPLDFQVTPVLAEDAPLELRPALGSLGPLATPGPRLWPFLLLGAVAILAAAPFAARAWLAHRARLRQRSAYEVARSKLDALLYGPRPDADHMDAFYVDLSDIVRHYLEDRFSLRSPELTTEEFLGELQRSPELSRSHQDLLRDFLGSADLVKFAHHLPSPDDVEASIQAAQRFLEETRGVENVGVTSPVAGAASAVEPARG